MKKLIYLPLIAFIVLTGCKGNSFMKQRYTSFSHATKKESKKESKEESKKELSNIRYEKNAAVPKKISTDQQTSETLVCATSPKNTQFTSRSELQVFKSKNSVEDGFNKNYSENNLLSKQEAKSYKSTTASYEKSKTAKDVVAGALNLLVSIIVLVVVIVLVIILISIVL